MPRVRQTSFSASTAVGVFPIRRREVLFALLVALCLVIASDLKAAEGTFVLVVNSHTREDQLDPTFVADAFLKKKTRWPDGEVIHPVDQRRDSAVRRAFSRDVLKRSVDAVRSYWQQRIFSGRDVPPPEVDSDVAVLRFVRDNPGAIGYVAEPPNVQGVRVITLK